MNYQKEVDYCVVCGKTTNFLFNPNIINPELKDAWGISDELVDAFNRRESMACRSCHSSLRVRQLCSVLLQTFAKMTGKRYQSLMELLQDQEFRKLRIAEINSCGYLHKYLKDLPNLRFSEYSLGLKLGEEFQGVRCENLQNLTYPDDYFDIILTSDTLEHIPDADKAWCEIYRTLKPGGYHIFTIPVISTVAKSVKRAELIHGSTEHYLKPAYHGSGHDEDYLVYTDFGMDIVEKLNHQGLKTEVFYLDPVSDPSVNIVFRSQKQSDLLPENLDWTGERFLPWIEGSQIHYEHLHRYALAAEFAQGKSVLDLASGEGYGSFMLSNNAISVTGIEIDVKSVIHAQNKYVKDNLKFIQGSILDIPIKDTNVFDIVVCFEAIEHITEHDKLLAEIKRLIKADGVLIISSPNKITYTDQPQYRNPFHSRELYFDDFNTLLLKYFKFVRFLGQRVYSGSHMWDISQSVKSNYTEFSVARDQNGFQFIGNDSKSPLYYIAIASNSELNQPFSIVNNSALLDLSDNITRDYENRISELVRAHENRISELVRVHENRISKLVRAHENQVNELVQTKDAQISGLTFQLQNLQSGISMNLLRRHQKIVEKVFPKGSRRRNLYELKLSAIRIILNEGWKSFWIKFKSKIKNRSVSAKDPR
jgi:ubiquinone/menaquinone biosynthesis C-methylase UbiE